MEILFLSIEIIFFSYFLYVAIYTLVFSLGGLFYCKPKLKDIPDEGKFAVLIPSYKEDGIIFSVANDALNNDYTKSNFDVVVIADSLQQATIEKLRSLPIKTLEVSFEKSTKVKALNHALDEIGDLYDYVIILDADNLMVPDYIKTVNDLHQQGYLAIQGRRAAKNEFNTLSYLDGLSEEINNHIYGRGSSAFGLSAALKGSGMSFSFKVLKDTLKDMSSVGGFDRELELRLVDRGIKILYASNAIILDEKVEKVAVFENQRKRWISSQFFYLKKYFLSGIANLIKGRIIYFNSAVLRNLQLPRLLNLGLISLFVIVLFFVQDHLSVPYVVWVISWLMTVVGIVLAIPRSYFGIRLFKSTLQLPGIFFKMFLLLFKLKGANKKFIHTPHGSTTQE